MHPQPIMSNRNAGVVLAPEREARARLVPAWKRVLDLALIAAAAPVLAPLMLLIAVGIKVVSRGPVLFKQDRIGLLGKPFVCYKFRSMRVNIGTERHQKHFQALVRSEVPMTKLDALGDTRLIPWGALLRATGLDELPQVFNIIRGEMSLVGPRPCTPYEYEHCYQDAHQGRFEALPGLTGLWQVSGKNDTTFSEMIDLDVRYARTQSLWQDLKIMFRTLPVVTAQTRRLFRRR